MYAMIYMRLDLAHAVGLVSCSLSNLENEHSIAVKWILRYLIGIPMCVYNLEMVNLYLKGLLMQM